MGIALFTLSCLLTPLRAPYLASLSRRARRTAQPGASSSPSCPQGTGAAPQAAAQRRAVPLRVVRVAEAGYRPGCAGRMVISGRMADVCAELDRLAAREAALAQR